MGLNYCQCKEFHKSEGPQWCKLMHQQYNRCWSPGDTRQDVLIYGIYTYAYMSRYYGLPKTEEPYTIMKA